MTTAIRDHRPRRRIRLRHVLGGWAVFVALFLLWQLVTYRGLMALAAEWEFDTFGRYYPTLTYVLMVIVLGSPILWLLRTRRRRTAALATATATATIARLPGLGFIRAILGLAIGCAVAAVIAVAVMLFQPDDQGVAARVTIGSAAAAAPLEGPTVVVGDIVGDRVAGLSEDLFLARRSFRFVPMLSPGGHGETLRYFAEVADAATLAAARRDGSLTGILKRGALPGELVRLFRYAGFEVAPDYYVLFADRESLQWPYRVIAMELALAALICALVALAMHVRRERLRQGTAAEAGNPLPAD